MHQSQISRSHSAKILAILCALATNTILFDLYTNCTCNCTYTYHKFGHMYINKSEEYINWNPMCPHLVYSGVLVLE